jgi:phenylalanyl-tRNA synthetase beta chain
MKISLEWLQDYLPGPLEARAAGEALTHGGLPVEKFEKHGSDDVIDVEITSNRGDCLSHVGVARELAALLDRPFQDVSPQAKESSTPGSGATAVAIEAPDLCPHYIARVIRGVKIGPSPAWMVRRLEAVGLRSINNVVDVTNYVMFEMGQPLHAFDFDQLRGRRIIVRRAKDGEHLVSLDGKGHTLTQQMLVIADAERPVALAGIIGGKDSEVTQATTNILLESARFDPLVVRKTARALAMESDSTSSRYRFERGIDPTLPQRASLRAAQLILETAGGALLAGEVAAGASGYVPKNLVLRLSKLKSVLGIDVPADEAVRALDRLQFSPRPLDGRIDVTVPHWRLDVNTEVDLVEEVARLIGYDRIPVRDEIAIRLQPQDTAAKSVEAIGGTLIAAGYYQGITFSFVSDALAEDFRPAEAASLPRADVRVRKTDARLRPSVIPGLLESLARNENNGDLGVKLYEIGSAFWTDAAGAMQERRRVGLVGSNDLHEVRGVVEAILSRLNAEPEIRIFPDRRQGFAAGAAARVEWGGTPIGWLGKIDRAIAEKLSLREIPAAAELDLDAIIQGARHVPQLKPLPSLPPVTRDLSLVVAESIRYEQIESLIRSLRPEHLEEAEYVTTYRGKPLEKGQKSVTLKLVFRAPDRTLTSEEVDASLKKIVDGAAKELRAMLRT